MRKIFFLVFMSMAVITASADRGDALKGIWPVTDPSLLKSLNGEWQLKVVKGISDDKTVPDRDVTWGTIPVPGCWEPYGFSEPKYNYPDSLTGYYRTTFTVPKGWKGQQVIIRLDGVLRGYDLWLNDQYVGTWESGYNTCLFDLTPYLTKKAFKGEPQQLAMRVYSQFKGYEFDCFDDWATMGIFREVTLFPVPLTHLSDLTVTTKINGEVTVKTEIANATPQTTTNYEILDATGKVVSTGEKIIDPQLWTAETPYLYTLRVCVKEEGKTLQTFTQKIGIREISIDGNILKVNGQSVKLRGVNAHSTDPYTVKVISDALTLKDMHMMKEASVNYMRLSHYPREPRFYELADSLGFYLVSEVPFGFGDKHLSKRSYQDILMTRAQATVSRDKNHPSVIVWSVGNENPLPQTCVEVGDYVGHLDPSRPYCFPQVGSYFRKFWEKAGGTNRTNGTNGHPFPSKAPVYAPHYPTTEQIGGFYQHLDRPVIFTEYCHTLGISFEDHDRQWDIIERTPGIAGGSVWEWADQGMPFNTSPAPSEGGDGLAVSTEFSRWRTDGSERDQKVYTSETGGFEMKGNFGTDGLLYADRTPLPNYYELQHNYARAFVGIKGCGSLAANLSITNRFDFIDLKDHVTFNWALTLNRDTVDKGSFSPDCPPHTTVPYRFPLPMIPQEVIDSALYALHFALTDADGHTFLHQSFVLNKPYTVWTGSGNPMELVQEQTIRTGRKPTMAERITQKGRLQQKYLLPLDSKEVKAEVQQNIAEGCNITFTLTPDTANVFRSELGLAYLLDKRIDRVQWIGYGPFASYPGRQQANHYGFWAKHMDDLYFEGNHAGIDAALLSDKDGNGVLVVGDSLNLNFEQTDRGIVLTVNAAVSGQGPKFAKTKFPGWQVGDGPVSATFQLYRIKADHWPSVVSSLFIPARQVPSPYKPFQTQYDTYLLNYDSIIALSVPVILVAGQSNADGRVPLSALPDELKTYKYCQWSYGSGDYETADGTFVPFSPRVAKPGIEQSWGFDAMVYHQLEEHWQRPFYVIKHTDGGTAIDPDCKRSTHHLYWSADSMFLRSTTSASHGGRSLLKAFEQQIDDCLPHLPQDYDIKCLVWHQGESDCEAPDRYYENLKAVVAHLRQHLAATTGKKKYLCLPVVCGTYAKGSRMRTPQVVEALERLQREDPNFHVVDAADLTLQRDRLHFDARGSQTLGQRFFEYMKGHSIVLSY